MQYIEVFCSCWQHQRDDNIETSTWYSVERVGEPKKKKDTTNPNIQNYILLLYSFFLPIKLKELLYHLLFANYSSFKGSLLSCVAQDFYVPNTELQSYPRGADIWSFGTSVLKLLIDPTFESTIKHIFKCIILSEAFKEIYRDVSVQLSSRDLLDSIMKDLKSWICFVMYYSNFTC